MEEWGFRRGKACRVAFVNGEKKVAVVAHGDDIVCLGAKAGLMWFKAEMAKESPLKSRGRLGWGRRTIMRVRC